MPNSLGRLGSWGENVARQYLEERGIRCLQKNVRSPFGEIDLVCFQGSELVIVEVKTRHSTRFGYPEESITRHKQRKLRQLAEWYWRVHPQYKSVRVDVIAILIDQESAFHVEHLVAAV